MKSIYCMRSNCQYNLGISRCEICGHDDSSELCLAELNLARFVNVCLVFQILFKFVNTIIITGINVT